MKHDIVTQCGIDKIHDQQSVLRSSHWLFHSRGVAQLITTATSNVDICFLDVQLVWSDCWSSLLLRKFVHFTAGFHRCIIALQADFIPLEQL